jgi:hypothetical protein
MQIQLFLIYDSGQIMNHGNLKRIFNFRMITGYFSRSDKMCGCWKCRREEGGTMYPSCMVTFEEEHSTRGRAHALQLFHGGILEKTGKMNT